MNLPAVSLLTAMAACISPPMVATPPNGLPMIEISTGGGFSDVSLVRIFADDTIQTKVFSRTNDPAPAFRQGKAGTFATAVAVLGSEGIKAKAAQLPDPVICTDYGVDYVKAEPPIAGFDQVSTGCPGTAVTTLIDHVLAVLVAP